MEKESNSKVIIDVVIVHRDVDPAATVMLINHDFAKNHPDILYAEEAT